MMSPSTEPDAANSTPCAVTLPEIVPSINKWPSVSQFPLKCISFEITERMFAPVSAVFRSRAVTFLSLVVLSNTVVAPRPRVS